MNRRRRVGSLGAAEELVGFARMLAVAPAMKRVAAFLLAAAKEAGTRRQGLLRSGPHVVHAPSSLPWFEAVDASRCSRDRSRGIRDAPASSPVSGPASWWPRELFWSRGGTSASGKDGVRRRGLRDAGFFFVAQLLHVERSAGR